MGRAQAPVAGYRAAPVHVVALLMGLALLLAMSAAGCRRAAPLPVTGVPWEDGELGAYAWVEGAVTVGAGTFGQRRVEGGWLIENSATLGSFEHLGSVAVDATTLLPKSSEILVSGAPASYEVQATYGQGKADLVARTADGERTLVIRLPGGHYVDNDQLLATMRCLPLAPGFKFTVNVVNTVGGTWLPILVEVEAVEQVELGVEGLEGASHQAYRVGLMGGQQRAWYTVAERHVLLRYNNGQRVCELRSFRTRGP